MAGVIERIFGKGKGGKSAPASDPLDSIAEDILSAVRDEDADALADALRALKAECGGSSDEDDEG
jgi:hypothetical protein